MSIRLLHEHRKSGKKKDNGIFVIFSHVPNTSQIKEGAEKLREVTTDRRSLNDVASIVKKSNNKLAELKSELHELESQILITKGNSVSNGQGKRTEQQNKQSKWKTFFNRSIVARGVVVINNTNGACSCLGGTQNTRRSV